MGDSYTIYFMLAGGLSMLGSWFSNRLKSKFDHYSRMATSSGMSGGEVAVEMLRQNNVSGVRIVQGEGFLTDHYNPMTKTVTLSPAVYQGRHISAAAVAAHECGHAIQHATGYPFLQTRSALVPFVKAASKIQGVLLVFALMLASTMPVLLLVVVIAFAVTTAFSLITLPVEFNASSRALKWLETSGITTPSEQDGAEDALWWAAMTYVAGALSSLVILAYLLFNYMSSRR
ncbi:MAG: zinc metallopeptidase [Saprospiraceae bacterium]